MNNNIDLFFQIYNLSHKSSLLDSVMIFGAEYLIFVVFFFMLILAIKNHSQEKKSLLIIFLGIILAEIIIKVIRIFYLEPRPFITYPIVPLVKHAIDPSFPSTHTAIMSVIAFGYYFSKSKFSQFFLLAMIWVGIARIYVGVHYPLDILGGIFVGFLSIFIIIQLKKLLHV